MEWERASNIRCPDNEQTTQTDSNVDARFNRANITRMKPTSLIKTPAAHKIALLIKSCCFITDLQSNMHCVRQRQGDMAPFQTAICRRRAHLCTHTHTSDWLKMVVCFPSANQSEDLNQHQTH